MRRVHQRFLQKDPKGRAIPPTVRRDNQAWVSASPVQCLMLRRQIWLFNRLVPLGAIITKKEGRELCAKPCWHAVRRVETRQEVTPTPQQPNVADKRDRQQVRYHHTHHPIPLISHKDLTALSFASISTSRRLSNHEDLNLRMPPPGGPSMHRAGLLCECYVT